VPCGARRRARRAWEAKSCRYLTAGASGVLLHLSSLDAALGRGGRAFIDWLATAGFSVWQILPLGPTGATHSPYWVRSDFAGNTAFIDSGERPSAEGDDYRAFLDASRSWLEDYADFEVLKRPARRAAVVAVAGRIPRPRQRGARAPARRTRRMRLRAVADRAVRVCIAVAGTARVRACARRAAPRRCAVLRGSGFCGSLDAPRAIPARCAGLPLAVAGVPPDYFSELRAAVGQYALRLGAHASRRFRILARARAPAARARGRAAHRSLSRAVPRTGQFRPARPMRAAAPGAALPVAPC
jgi:hypothetical protein